MRALLLLSLLLWSPLARGDSVFRKQHVEHPPFRSVELWAPSAGSPAAPRRVMLLLYGNQGDVLDPTCLVAMGHTPPCTHPVLSTKETSGPLQTLGSPAVRHSSRAAKTQKRPR